MREEAIQKRIEKCIAARNEFLKDIDNVHVKLQKGNRKTGTSCWTVSLLPIIDCGKNCKGCMKACYDLRNDLMYPSVINDRAKNSAIHKASVHRYWFEVNQQIQANHCSHVRINVGGDLGKEDFPYIVSVAKQNSNTEFLFFTKSYEELNSFLDEYRFPANVHPIMSAWEGITMENPHNLPCSHVLYKDGRTTAPQYGAYYCGGNCTDCANAGEGCWNLKNGEHVIFKVH